jgi:hypothetical protein
MWNFIDFYGSNGQTFILSKLTRKLAVNMEGAEGKGYLPSLDLLNLTNLGFIRNFRLNLFVFLNRLQESIFTDQFEP